MFKFKNIKLLCIEEIDNKGTINFVILDEQLGHRPAKKQTFALYFPQCTTTGQCALMTKVKDISDEKLTELYQ